LSSVAFELLRFSFSVFFFRGTVYCGTSEHWARREVIVHFTGLSEGRGESWRLK